MKHLNKKVIIRTEKAGVHFGILDKYENKEASLRESIRIWYWDGANSLSEMALSGVKKPESCKFSVKLDEIHVCGVIEIIPCTDEAIKIIENVKPWKY